MKKRKTVENQKKKEEKNKLGLQVLFNFNLTYISPIRFKI